MVNDNMRPNSGRGGVDHLEEARRARVEGTPDASGEVGFLA